MSNDWHGVDLGKLSRLATRSQLFQCADSVAGTALVPANFVLFNPGTKGLAIAIISARISATVAGMISLGTVQPDPALTAGNAPSNLRIADTAPEAGNEVQAVAAITLLNTIAEPQLGANLELELLSPGVVYLPPGWGLGITTPIAVVTYSVTWLWAEVPRE
jgi:hypothetical protein